MLQEDLAFTIPPSCYASHLPLHEGGFCKGYSSTEDARNVSLAFEMFPLAFALSTADSEATYFIESETHKKKEELE